MDRVEVSEGVQAFNLWTIWIVARLLEEFPQPQLFVCGPGRVFVTGNHTLAGDAFGPTDPALVQKFCPTMDWLLAEGYVRGKSNGAGHYALVSLAERAMAVLGQPPRSIASPHGSEKPLGALIREAVASKATGAVVTALFKALTHGD
jgi:hypothetical protein